MRLQLSLGAGALLALSAAFAACATSTAPPDNFGDDASNTDGSTPLYDGGYGGPDSTIGDTGAATDSSTHADAAHDASFDATLDALSDATFDAPADAFIPLDGPCGPGNCGWCCTASGQCLSGPSDTQCGASGASCVDCTQSSQVCSMSTGTCEAPQPCGAATCPNGCCSNGVCQSTQSDTQCGTGGNGCTDCTVSGDVCTSGTCAPEGGVLDPFCEFDCTGCCDSNNFCFAGTATNACGTSGATCNDCATTGATCIGGFCALPDGAVEDPNCASDCTTGCCDTLGICHTGASTNTSCGTNGGTCLDCTVNGGTCIGGFCTLPDGAVEDPNCANDCNGCCDLGNVCQPGTSRTQCGSFGEACQNCGSSLVCVAMTCQ
jgi:hypothetical protein